MANRVQALTIETTILVSTTFPSDVNGGPELAGNARRLPEFPAGPNVDLDCFISENPGQSQGAADIAGIDRP
jgi:hypothetical protein